MLKQITFSHHGRRAGIVWLSFQPDGAISCGLRDRTYIAPHMRERVGVWNLYNRVGIEYVVPTDLTALLPVENPHFTFHPTMLFHLKAHNARSSADEDMFEGIADVKMTLTQQLEMPWLRLTSQPLSRLLTAGGPRADGITSDELVHILPTLVPDASAKVEIDFIRTENVALNRTTSPWEFAWHDVVLRVRALFTPPQIATLS
jgi:hypothetical protein